MTAETMDQDHIQEQLCARIDELEREKEVLASQVDHLETERDALAAHLDDIRAAYAKDCPLALAEALNSAPDASLARLIAEWQAEALEEIVSVFADPDSESALDVVEYAAELANLKRRQAEGGG
ncbi:MAG: hypothetical protein ACQEUM_07025 [Pseudomonadota bacterium]